MEIPSGFCCDMEIVIPKGAFISLHSTPDPDLRIIKIDVPGADHLTHYHLTRQSYPLPGLGGKL